MTQLATRNGAGSAGIELSARSKIDEMWMMAESIARSGLFAAKTADQAFALMLICDAEGIHPVKAMKMYHIIQNRPAMRSDYMQGFFQEKGGWIRVITRTPTEARAVFGHPVHQPDGFELSVTIDQYQKAGLTGKDNWKHYPDDMLWARLVTKGIRTIMPGIIAGIYSADEAEDLALMESAPVRAQVAIEQAAEVVAAAQVAVIGSLGQGYDNRQFREVVADAIDLLNTRIKDSWSQAFGTDVGAPKTILASDVHRHLMNQAVQTGKVQDLPPDKTGQFAAMKALYAREQDWVRGQLNEHLDGIAGKVQELIRVKQETAQAAAPQPAREPGEDG